MEEEKGLLDGQQPMLRIALKGKLIKDCDDVFDSLEKYRKCHSKAFHRKARKTIFRDFKKGLTQINNKVDIYVELPKFESTSTGHSEHREDVDGNPETVIIENPLVEQVKKRGFLGWRGRKK
ncbi:MAG: hypothetical protein J6K39_02815 [Clostridia bacterium]|nr:hypothetical protein [Clostridia bacterium]